MSKIAVVGLHSLHLMQFLYKYTDIMDRNNIEYDVLYWDRDMDTSIKVKAFSGKGIPFSYKMSNYQPKYKKIIGFMKCLRFMVNTINDNQYEKIILLTTQTAFPLYLLSGRVRKSRYIYDYRDLTYEKIPVCKRIIQHIIKNSVFTAISSLGFKDVLGESNRFIISHNVSGLTYCEVKRDSSSKIRLVYWGMIRQLSFNKKICDVFCKDSRFEVHYHGEGQNEELESYCKEKGYDNVFFTGRYMVDEIKAFVQKTDILLNLYENDGQQRLATTVKLYDGIRYGLPMLITRNSHMASLMKDNKHVLSVEINERTADYVAKWFATIANEMDYPYIKKLEKIQKDDLAFEEKLLKYIRE